MKGAVSSGHRLTTEAAIRMLEKGGNAFDAIVAAGFAASAAETIFATLGGGGFLLCHNFEEKEDFFYDFFVNTPGLGMKEAPQPELVPMLLNFAETTQVFHVGMASIGIPGTLKGLIHCYKENCTMDLDTIVAPAIECLENGIPLNESQKNILNVVRPIFETSEYCREMFYKNGAEKIYNPDLKEFLKKRSIDEWEHIVYGGGASRFIEDVQNGGGQITREDLKSYSVIRREPFRADYRGHEILSNPPPSFGGQIICAALKILNDQTFQNKDAVEKALMRAGILRKINHMKAGAGGTTHINVIDSKNNAASMSLSAGTGCGYILPGTGIMMNNTMGEEDLHPDAFYSGPAGERVPSMMAPTFIKKEGLVTAALGSGGSHRIRSAILQVIMNLIDEQLDVVEAVESPRMHFDEHDVLHIEPPQPEEVLEQLKKTYPEHYLWTKKDLYFGGVHTVTGTLHGHGDSRRDGVFLRLG